MKQLHAKNLSHWRKWLEENHDKEKSVWLVVNKVHTGKPSLKHRESMEEAICFGWIDTIIKRLDEDRYIRGFAKRSKNSKWSANTRKYARELIKARKMTPAGLAAYKEGLKRPTHDYGIPRNPGMIPDLKAELGDALANFEGFSPSYQRTCLRWILGAKLPETRKKRIDAVAKAAMEKRKVF